MILIVPNELKKEYLKKQTIHNYKFYNLNEIKDKIFFKYSSEILYIVSKKYKVLPSIAKKMLENLYYINTYKTDKLETLFNLKKYLLENNYIKKNNCFLETLNDEVRIEGYPKTKEINIIINELSKYTKVIYKDFEAKYELKEIYEFKTASQEIEFLCENILNLIHKGININKIVVINSNSDYIGIINRTFNLFNIPFAFNEKKSLTLFKETKEFLNKIKYSSLKISELNELLDEIKNEEIKTSIIGVLNKYFKIEENVKELYDVIYYELKNTYFKGEYSRNVINIYQDTNIFDENTYVFCISCNEEILLNDNDYLTDAEKEIIGINTSFELNEINNLYKLNVLKNVKNLTLSYKKNFNNNMYVINSIFENLKIKNYEFLHNSANFNIYLFSNVNLFDNTYKKINFKDLEKFLDGKFNLSYSSIDMFFKCKFRFFLNNIVKAEPNVDTMSIQIGNMFHDVLEKVLKNNFQDYLNILDDVSKNYLNGNLKEKFYKEKLKKEIVKKIEDLKEILNKSDFKNTYFEKYLEINLNTNLNIKLDGFIDKILTYFDDLNTYIVVVDYKTGNAKIDLNRLKDGFNMQLFIYLYLIIKTNLFKNPIIAGAYIDHILEELKPSEFGKKYLDIINNKLDGISTNNKEILKKIDNFYDVKSFIKGLKLKNDGNFYYYSKVFSEKDINNFLNIVESKINEVVKSILDCDFEINPKKYSTENEIVGCNFCHFKEICYMNYKNVLILESGEKDEINC